MIESRIVLSRAAHAFGEDGPAPGDIPVRTEAIAAQAVALWHADVLEEVAYMSRRWAGGKLTGEELMAALSCFSSIADDIRLDAVLLGCPVVEHAADDLADALIETEAFAGGGFRLGRALRNVASALTGLRACVVETAANRLAA